MTVELEMLVGLSGPEYSLSPGDKRNFPGELVDGKVTGEAGRLIDAGYAKLPVDEESSVAENDEKPAPRKRKKAD